MASFFNTARKISKVANTIANVNSVTNAVRRGNSRDIASSVLDLATNQRNIENQINGISGFKDSFSLNGVSGNLPAGLASFGTLGGRVSNILGAALELEGIINSPIRLLDRGTQEIYDLTGGRFDTLRKQVENLSQISAFDKFINNNFSDPRDPIKKTGDAKSRIPNPLREFSSYNYKITMGILSNKEYNNPETYRKRGGFETYIIKSTGGELGKRTQVDQETIASPSGHGEYFIDNLEYSGVVAPNPSTGVTLGTTLSFKVVEPFSMGNFVEAITVAARLSNDGKGYESYFNAPFCMRIDFSGWVEEEQQYGEKLKPIYLPIMITGMEMRVTGQGSEYDVTAVAYNEQALSDHANKLYTQVKAVGTFAHEVLQTGDKSVATSLNKRVEKLEESNVIPGYDRYIICFPKNVDSINNYLETGISKPEEKTGLQAIQEEKGTAELADIDNPDIKLNRREETSKNSITKPVTGMFETLLAFASDETQMNEIGKSGLIKESSTGGDQAMGSMKGALQADTADNPNADAANDELDITEDPDNPCGPETAGHPGLIEKDSATTQPAEFARQYAFSKDEKIVTVIEKVLLSSEFCKESASEDSDENGVRRWFRIDTQTYLEENTVTEKKLGRQPMVFVFAIHPYEADEAKFLAPDEVPKNTTGLRESAAKEYNYLYTGNNEDVLGFDIQFNTAFMRTALGNYGNNAGPDATGTANKKVVKTEQTTAGKASNDPQGREQIPGGVNENKSVEAKPGVQEITLNPSGNASRDADIRRQIAENFHNILIHQPSDMITAEMRIWGDPFFLPQEIGNHHAKQEGASPNSSSDGTMLYTKGEVFVVVNFRSPFDYQVNGASMEMPLIVPQFSGLFSVIQVTNSFSGGQYTQNLSLVRRVAQDTPATSDNKGTMAADSTSTYKQKLPDSSSVTEEQRQSNQGSTTQKKVNETINLLEQGANAIESVGSAISSRAGINASAVSALARTGATAAGALGFLDNFGKVPAQATQSFFDGNAKFDANKFKASIPEVNLQSSGNASFDLSAAVNQALLVAVPAFGAFQIDNTTPAGKLGLLASELQDEFNMSLGQEPAPVIADATAKLKENIVQISEVDLSPASVIRTTNRRAV